MNIAKKNLLFHRPAVRPILVFLLFSCFFAVSGCLNSRFYTSLNPEFEGKKKYGRILIQFPDRDLDYCRYGESTAKELIEKRFGDQVVCFLCSEHIYMGIKPTTQMSKDTRNFIKAHQIDAVLIGFKLGRKRRWEENSFPSAGGKGATTKTTTIKNLVEYRLEMFDVKAKKSVWYSGGHYEGDSIAFTYKKIIRTFLEKSIADLESKDLLGAVEDAEDGNSAPSPKKAGSSFDL